MSDAIKAMLPFLWKNSLANTLKKASFLGVYAFRKTIKTFSF